MENSLGTTMEFNNGKQAVNKNEPEETNMQNEKHVATDTEDEPKIHYRGWKVMPFIIG